MKAGKSQQKIISLFSGAGGMDIGFELAGFKTAVAVEFDESCCATLKANRPSLEVIHGDLFKISTQAILKAGKLQPTEAAFVIGGPPCQSFSLAGKRMGMNDPRGMLVLEFIRVVREALPVGFVMENVKGMVNWEKGKAIDAIINEISEPIYFNGKTYQYNVSYAVLNSADYGVAQFRERVFIVGNRMNKRFEFPTRTHGDVAQQSALFSEQKLPYVTVWDAIGALPPAEEPSENALRIAKTIKKRIDKHGY
jgi:DNA (cytosine-5)-methyltransferase 1